MFASYENHVRVYVGRSRIKFDMSIPVDSIFGPERDGYCRHMFERAVLRGEEINPWHMWKRVSDNVVTCKYCRLFGNTEIIRHECGWWENARGIDGRICFCFCHDDLGYALKDGDQFVFCNWTIVKGMLRRLLRQVNELKIDYIHGESPSYIKYVASRDGTFVFSDDNTGELLPNQILSIQAFSECRRHYNTFMDKRQDYRSTALGQFMTMQSKRYFQRCSKSLWTLRDDKQFAMIMNLEGLCMRATARAQEPVIAVESKCEDTQD